MVANQKNVKNMLAYHGTSYDFLEDIISDGLIAGTDGKVWFILDRESRYGDIQVVVDASELIIDSDDQAFDYSVSPDRIIRIYDRDTGEIFHRSKPHFS